jgi:hypothetical protein
MFEIENKVGQPQGQFKSKLGDRRIKFYREFEKTENFLAILGPYSS